MNPANILIKTRRSLCCAGILALILPASTARAAVAITGNYLGATAPTLNNTYGTLEFALNTGGIALIRDGITFTAAGINGAPTSQTLLSSGGSSGTVGVVAVADGGQTWGTGDLGGSDALFNTIIFPNGSQGYDINITGLDSGKSYQLQFLFGDPRTSPAYPFSGDATVTDSLANSAVATVSFGSSSSADEFAMLTAVVSGSASFQLSLPAASGGPLLSGVVVHSVPEPSAALLGGLGLLALLRRRR